VGGDGTLNEILLFGNIDRNADEVRPDLALLTGQLAANAQPQPAAGGIAHPKSVICRLQRAVEKLASESIKIDVVLMDERVDFAERQEIVLLPQAEHVVH